MSDYAQQLASAARKNCKHVAYNTCRRCVAAAIDEALKAQKKACAKSLDRTLLASSTQYLFGFVYNGIMQAEVEAAKAERTEA